ncbi:hypothetical protein MVES_001964 [Malassezia vespertilionis]|uniref:Sulfhydryl oxidase n=2 Tax=Malassezia vespertilionis TaxID=2020962 RepID=A0A2N1JC49_9BASI|nr:hypothetical protein MVES_001964 [Malassezia vespertilionis]
MDWWNAGAKMLHSGVKEDDITQHIVPHPSQAARPVDDANSEPIVNGAYAPKMANETAKAELGRATWHFLHTMTLRFPDKPTEQQSQDLREFFRLFSLLYPCGDCATHFQQLLIELPPQAGSRKNAAIWLCNAHNAVNKRLGHSQFNCTDLDSTYDCGCGSDTIDLATINPSQATGEAHIM